MRKFQCDHHSIALLPVYMRIYSSASNILLINSFLLNKYWTFGQEQRTTRGEVARFALVTIGGILWSSLILWLASIALHSFLVNATLWANVSKLVAIGGTALISYLGMRLWVFVSKRSGSELFTSTRRWHREERAQTRPLLISERHPF